jgi:hypothetical protein
MNVNMEVCFFSGDRVLKRHKDRIFNRSLCFQLNTKTNEAFLLRGKSIVSFLSFDWKCRQDDSRNN